MSEGKWSNARRAKKAERQKMFMEFQREYLLDDEEKEYLDKKQREDKQ